jgi:hypothetical protein
VKPPSVGKWPGQGHPGLLTPGMCPFLHNIFSLILFSISTFLQKKSRNMSIREMFASMLYLNKSQNTINVYIK